MQQNRDYHEDNKSICQEWLQQLGDNKTHPSIHPWAEQITPLCVNLIMHNCGWILDEFATPTLTHHTTTRRVYLLFLKVRQKVNIWHFHRDENWIDTVPCLLGLVRSLSHLLLVIDRTTAGNGWPFISCGKGPSHFIPDAVKNYLWLETEYHLPCHSFGQRVGRWKKWRLFEFSGFISRSHLTRRRRWSDVLMTDCRGPFGPLLDTNYSEATLILVVINYHSGMLCSSQVRKEEGRTCVDTDSDGQKGCRWSVRNPFFPHFWRVQDKWATNGPPFQPFRPSQKWSVDRVSQSGWLWKMSWF